MLALFFSCNDEKAGSEGSRDKKPSDIFADYRITADEGKEAVTCLLQFYEGGPRGATLLGGRRPRLLAGLALPFWFLCGLLGAVMAFIWFGTAHDAGHEHAAQPADGLCSSHEARAAAADRGQPAGLQPPLGRWQAAGPSPVRRSARGPGAGCSGLPAPAGLRRARPGGWRAPRRLCRRRRKPHRRAQARRRRAPPRAGRCGCPCA